MTNHCDACGWTIAPVRLVKNDGAISFITGGGKPKTGKTNTMAVIAELWKIQNPADLIISNVRSWELTDIVATSAHDQSVSLLEHRETPKFVVIDEGSTHFDARTHSRDGATQWPPLAKRMGKIGVAACGVIIHTGKDLHPEQKRLTKAAF